MKVSSALIWSLICWRSAFVYLKKISKEGNEQYSDNYFPCVKWLFSSYLTKKNQFFLSEKMLVSVNNIHWAIKVLVILAVLILIIMCVCRKIIHIAFLIKTLYTHTHRREKRKEKKKKTKDKITTKWDTTRRIWMRVCEGNHCTCCTFLLILIIIFSNRWSEHLTLAQLQGLVFLLNIWYCNQLVKSNVNDHSLNGYRLCTSFKMINWNSFLISHQVDSIWTWCSFLRLRRCNRIPPTVSLTHIQGGREHSRLLIMPSLY